jgi:hypothetical protein
MISLERLVLLLLPLCNVVAPAPAIAWWDLGHMQIAAVAFDKLEPSVRGKVATLLELNPDYQAWTAGVPDADRDRTAFVRAATWADDIKRRPDYIKDGNHPSGPHAADNIGYVDKHVHGYWHFIDFPFSPDHTPLQVPAEPNALTQIAAFRDTLAGPASQETKSYDLVWLIHIVGDAHQPLHATSRFTSGLRNGDSGGNEEKVCVSLDCGLKLHAFWDGVLGDRGSVADATAAAALLPVPDPAAAAIADPRAWFKESFGLAQEAVYTPAIGDGHGPFTLDAEYQGRALAIAKNRAALAAARLANLLNAALR